MYSSLLGDYGVDTNIVYFVGNGFDNLIVEGDPNQIDSGFQAMDKFVIPSSAITEAVAEGIKGDAGDYHQAYFSGIAALDAASAHLENAYGVGDEYPFSHSMSLLNRLLGFDFAPEGDIEHDSLGIPKSIKV